MGVRRRGATLVVALALTGVPAGGALAAVATAASRPPAAAAARTPAGSSAPARSVQLAPKPTTDPNCDPYDYSRSANDEILMKVAADKNCPGTGFYPTITRTSDGLVIDGCPHQPCHQVQAHVAGKTYTWILPS